MDRALITKFREEVNDQNLVIQMYRNRNGKALWNIICSAMDWIDVVVDSIDIHKLSRGNDNDASVRMMTFIVCVDVLWESVQQLHRVIFDTKDVPFQADTSIFRHKLFPTTDNNYFKTIRACFATHPINLNDQFSGDNKKEKRYASWSGGSTGNGDFAVFLYSNHPEHEPLTLNIYFDELLDFAKVRYSHLQTIMREIKRQKDNYLDCWRKQIIPVSNDPLEQIKILAHEVEQRYHYSDYYRYEVEKLRIIFETDITNPRNKKIVKNYRDALLSEVKELHITLQRMTCAELESERNIDDSCPFNCHYAFSKLSDAVYGNGDAALIDVESLRLYLKSWIDFSEICSIEELYTVVCAGFFAMNTSKNNG